MDYRNIPVLESDTLILRPWIKEYAEDYLRILGNARVAAAEGVKKMEDLSDAKKKIRAMNKSQRTEWSVALKTEDEQVIVGGISICEVISIKEYKTVKEIGYGIGEEYWGRGITPKAVKIVEDYCFGSLGCDALIIRIMENNLRSKRVAEKCGYTYHSKKKIGSRYKINYIKVKRDR